MENYYELLGVSPSASKEELEKAIFKQQRLWHSRVNSADFERRVKAERMLRKLEEIQDVLLDDEKREEYNKSLFTLSISSFRSEAEEQNKTTESAPEEKESAKIIEPQGGSETTQEREKEENLESPHKSITKDPGKDDDIVREVQKEEKPLEDEKRKDQQEDPMSPGEMYRLGKRMIDENKSETELIKGIEWMIRAAEAGNIYAMYQLAQYFFEGVVLPPDPTEGEKWLGKAAEAGYVPAMVELGVRLLEGDQLPRDSARGIAWIGKAAEMGDEKAKSILNEWMYKLGNYFLNTAFNREKGGEWLRKAAEAGYVPAMLELGRMLVDGDKLEKNTTEGITWLVKAANNGSNEAQQLLDARLSREQTKQSTNPTADIFQSTQTSFSSSKKEETQFTTNETQSQLEKKKRSSTWIATVLVVVVIIGAVSLFNEWIRTEEPPPKEITTTPEENNTNVEEEPIENVDEPKQEEVPEQNQQWTPPTNSTDNNNDYQQPNNSTTDPNQGGTTDPNQGGTTDPGHGGTTDPGQNGGTDNNQGGDAGGGGNSGSGGGGSDSSNGSGNEPPPSDDNESE